MRARSSLGCLSVLLGVGACGDRFTTNGETGGGGASNGTPTTGSMAGASPAPSQGGSSSTGTSGGQPATGGGTGGNGATGSGGAGAPNVSGTGGTAEVPVDAAGANSGGAPEASGGSSGPGGNSGTAGTNSSGGAVTTPAPDPNCGSFKWACWPMPNPEGSGLPNEASYMDGEDGTLLDLVTELTWQLEAPDDTFTWQAAIDYCDGLTLGDRDDWRLPSRIEMTSIVDYSQSGTKVDSAAFPGAAGAFHKTASEWILSIDDRSQLDVAWSFNLSDGIVSNNYNKDEPARLRCVASAGEGEAPGEAAAMPPDLYTTLNDDEVRDNYTGLVWQRLDSDVPQTWEEAVDYCATLTLGGETWRLPSIREAATLVDEAKVAPSIDEQIFPNTKYGSRTNNWYWASHRAVGQSTAAWAINHDDGFTGFNAGQSGAWNFFETGFSRCVR